MVDFINTIDALGDETAIDSIISKTITEFKDNKVTFIGDYAFYKCSALNTVDIPNATYIAQRSFQACTELISVSLPNVSVIYDSAFNGCTKLASIVLPSIYNLTASVFEGCTALKTVDIYTACPIKTKNFYNCSALTALIIRSTSGVPEMPYVDCLSGTPISNGAGYIYVPSALVDRYKTATNWSTYANQIRAIENYTIDGTVTGELDETKI